MVNPQIRLFMGKGSILGDSSMLDFQNRSEQISRQLEEVQSLFQAEKVSDLVSYNRAWTIVPKLEDEYIQSILECAHDIRDNFKAFVTIGIGGSDLCARLYHESLNPAYYHLLCEDKRGKAPEIYFTGDTFDPRGLNGLLSSLKDRCLLDKTAFHVVSKSGRTAETFGSVLIIRKWLEDRGHKDWEKRFIVTTGGSPTSALYNMNVDRPFRHIFIMPEGVGGRFSAFTSVGLLLLAITASSPEKPEDRLLKAIDGIKYADDMFKLPFYHRNNVAYRLAGWLHLAEAMGKSIMEFYDYADQRLLADWFVQLYDESVQERGQGLTVRPLRGPTCNHSALNGIMNGPKDKALLFLQWKDLNVDAEIEIPAYDDVKDPELAELGGLKLSELQMASYSGTSEDFTQKGVPNVTLTISKRDVKNVIALMRILMDTVAVKGRLQGLHLDANGFIDFEKELTYLQDGVEGFKKGTRKLAAEIKAKQAMG